MLKRIVLASTVAMGAVLFAIICAPGAEAARNISSCGTLDVAGETYNLTSDIAAGPGNCLVVANNRIRINLQGHSISGSGSGSAITDAGIARNKTTVVGTHPAGSAPGTPNGGVFDFKTGIDLRASTRSEIRDVESAGHLADGIWAGPYSLIKGCLVKDNAGNGIVIGDFGQVQNCTIGGESGPAALACCDGNGIDGIVGGQHVLVAQNVITVNGGTGITVGEFATVSSNTASGNGFAGVLAGSHSLITGNTATDNGDGCNSSCAGASGIETADFSTVTSNIASGNAREGIEVEGIKSTVTGNTTNDNGDTGIQVECPGTVTNNTSSGNGIVNYELEGTGCFQKSNT